MSELKRERGFEREREREREKKKRIGLSAMAGLLARSSRLRE